MFTQPTQKSCQKINTLGYFSSVYMMRYSKKRTKKVNSAGKTSHAKLLSEIWNVFNGVIIQPYWMFTQPTQKSCQKINTLGDFSSVYMMRYSKKRTKKVNSAGKTSHAKLLSEIWNVFNGVIIQPYWMFTQPTQKSCQKINTLGDFSSVDMIHYSKKRTKKTTAQRNYAHKLLSDIWKAFSWVFTQTK